MTFLSNIHSQMWRTIVLIIAVLLTTGCSASKTVTPVHFPIYQSEEWIMTATDENNSPLVNLKPKQEGSSVQGFATAFKTCGYAPSVTLRGASRQFFVGLEKLQILSQGPISISSYQLWKVEAEAQNDGLPIILETYTLKKDLCFYDFALWIPKLTNLSDAAKDREDIVALQTHFYSLISGMVPKI